MNENAKKRKAFVKLDNPSHQGMTNTWLTPLWLINKLPEFDLDPCGFFGHKTAKKIICLPDDGLKAEWSGKVFLNPPYGKETGKWLDKLILHGSGVALVFARTDTKWFQDSAKKSSWVFFLRGRIKFLTQEFKEMHNAGHGSCLIGFGMDESIINNIDGVLLKNKI